MRALKYHLKYPSSFIFWTCMSKLLSAIFVKKTNCYLLYRLLKLRNMFLLLVACSFNTVALSVLSRLASVYYLSEERVLFVLHMYIFIVQGMHQRRGHPMRKRKQGLLQELHENCQANRRLWQRRQ